MKIAHILLYCQAHGLTLEWKTGDRTFQVCGDRRMTGLYERFFHADSHPTRSTVPEAQMQPAFDAGAEFLLYRTLYDDGEKLSRDDLVARIGQFSPRE